MNEPAKIRPRLLDSLSDVNSHSHNAMAILICDNLPQIEWIPIKIRTYSVGTSRILVTGCSDLINSLVNHIYAKPSSDIVAIYLEMIRPMSYEITGLASDQHVLWK